MKVIKLRKRYNQKNSSYLETVAEGDLDVATPVLNLLAGNMDWVIRLGKDHQVLLTEEEVRKLVWHVKMVDDARADDGSQLEKAIDLTGKQK